MSTTYNDIMNKHNLSGMLLKIDSKYYEEFYNLRADVTEKIHGENIRCGVDNKGSFIGQRKTLCRDFTDHSNWNKLSVRTKDELGRIHIYITNKKRDAKFAQKNITFFGELHGQGMQKGFTYPFSDGLRVRWFDIKVNDRYELFVDKQEIFRDLGLESVPYIGRMTIRESLDLDIENMKSQVAEQNFIEGVVITPEVPDWWRFHSRLIIKHKTKKFAEAKQGKSKSVKPINNFVSEYVDFVTEARIDHAIQALKERKIEILYELRDLQYIPKEVIADIEKEENDGHPLPKEDKKYLGSYIPRYYKKYLDDMLVNLQQELLNIKKEAISAKK